MCHVSPECDLVKTEKSFGDHYVVADSSYPIAISGGFGLFSSKSANFGISNFRTVCTYVVFPTNLVGRSARPSVGRLGGCRKALAVDDLKGRF